MKTWLIRMAWILAGLMLMAGCACATGAAEQPPEEIRSALAGREITHSAYWSGEGSTWFILTRTSEGASLLQCFENSGGVWVQSFCTYTAVPQGANGVQMIHITDHMEDHVYDRIWPGPILIILTDDGSYTSYLRSGSGQWNLFKVFRQDEQTYLDFDEESIVFRTPIDQEHSRFETVHGRFERDLRKIDLNSIPGTPEEAERMRDEMQPATEDAGGQ